MHRPVLVNEIVDGLAIHPHGRYVDGTVGLGGHAEEILRRLAPDGRLLALDVDAQTLAQAENRLQPFGSMAVTRLASFRELPAVLQDLEWSDVNGMIFDLGISSMQLDDPERGLSFQHNTPLDMRLDRRSPTSALRFLQSVDDRKLVDLFTQFGEGRHARNLSRAILNSVSRGAMNTTGDLAALCERIVGRRHGKIHPATRVFLALRCAVNDELGALEDLLKQAPNFLRVGGRLAVISFHSLEDRPVKQAFRALSQEGRAGKKFSLLTKKPVIPSEAECRSNPRARSAKLRVVERVS